MTPPHNHDDEKRFDTLRATAAMAGYEVLRTDPADGAVRYLACRWNVVRDLGGLNEAERFALVVGGKP